MAWWALAQCGWAQAEASSPTSLQIAPGVMQIFTDNRDLLFSDVVLDGSEKRAQGVQAPAITIADVSGSGAGWRVYFQATDFTGSSGGRIPAQNFSYRAQKGVLSRLEGQPLDVVGPGETGLAGNLASPLLVLASPARHGMGTYQWRPFPGSFLLTVPPETLVGSYRAVVTVTLVRGFP